MRTSITSFLFTFAVAIIAAPQLGRAAGIAARPASEFLASIGVDSGIDQRGEDLQHTIECTNYLGIHWFRTGIEGDLPIETYVKLHRKTGALFSWFPGSGGADLEKLLATGRKLAVSGALMAFEGPNEPNNWPITYEGQTGGRGETSWVPVAHFMRDLCAAVKRDAVLRKYPVWDTTETGAQMDNVGLQFLTVPSDAGCLLPSGTKLADSANCHNYIYHPSAPGLEDNKTWNASDPTSACKVDGLYGNYGLTWRNKYSGYSEAELETLPRVTTETGTTINGPITEEIQALNYLSLYLDQFKRGWSHTAIYLLRDRSDEDGNQSFGFYKPDYTPRKAAVYLHNLTTILADQGTRRPASLDYTIANEPATVHDMLLQKSNGTLELVVWDERVSGTDRVTIDLGRFTTSATIYDPTKGTAPVKTLGRVRSIAIDLSDHPLIIEIPSRR